MWINLPAALALVASLRWLLQQHEARVKASLLAGAGLPHRRRRHAHAEAGASKQGPGHSHHQRADAKSREVRWRDKVGSDLVAEAWELLCGSILQEVWTTILTIVPLYRCNVACRMLWPSEAWLAVQYGWP